MGIKALNSWWLYRLATQLVRTRELQTLRTARMRVCTMRRAIICTIVWCSRYREHADNNTGMPMFGGDSLIDG